MEDIKSLKRKRKPSGDAAGRALLGVLANDYHRRRDPSAPIYGTMDDIEVIIKKLPTSEDVSRYRFYEDLYFSIIANHDRQRAEYNYTTGYMSMAMDRVSRYASTVATRAALMAEPLVITKATKNKALNVHMMSQADVVNELCYQYAQGCDNTPEAVREYLQSSKSAPSESPEPTTIEVLEDGRRSSDYTPREWLELKKGLYPIDVRIAAKDIFPDNFHLDMRTDGIKMMVRRLNYYCDAVRYLLAPVTDEQEREAREMLNLPFLPLKEEPAERSQYDDIVDGHYPEGYLVVVRLALDDITNGELSYTYKRLQAAGVNLDELAAYRSYFKGNAGALDRLEHGVAVTSNDDYIRSEIPLPRLQPTPAAEILRGMQFVYAYNGLIDIYAELYDVPELTWVKFDTTKIESFFDMYNDLIADIKHDYQDDDDLRADVEMLEPIRIEQAKPTPEAMQAIKKDLQDHGYSRYVTKMAVYSSCLLMPTYRW